MPRLEVGAAILIILISQEMSRQASVSRNVQKCPSYSLLNTSESLRHWSIAGSHAQQLFMSAVYHISVWEQHIVMPYGIQHTLKPTDFYAVWDTALDWKVLSLNQFISLYKPMHTPCQTGKFKPWGPHSSLWCINCCSGYNLCCLVGSFKCYFKQVAQVKCNIFRVQFTEGRCGTWYTINLRTRPPFELVKASSYLPT